MSQSADHAHQMDRMYRYTRLVYDLTRRYYLLGRDQLLREMSLRPGDRVLEMGCGTGRNLVRLSRLHPDCALFGIDASRLMLDTAQRSAVKSGDGGKIQFRRCLAEQVRYDETFGLHKPFDVIFFSYSLSMILEWKMAIEAAIQNLSPDGRLYIVDFYDQAGLPRWFARVLKNWLALFHVHYCPEMMEHLEHLAESRKIGLTVKPVAKRYAYLAVIELGKSE